jgi:CDP-diacylglycerol---serine O-phosphatidyltransferase
MIAVDKQKKLLHEATGHFTMIRMLHLADLITELNGKWGARAPLSRALEN